MHMVQGQILQAALPGLSGCHGAVGRAGIHGVPVNQADLMLLLPPGPEALQQPRAVHLFIARAPHPAVQARQRNAFPVPGKDMQIPGPPLRLPKSAVIVVSRSEKRGDLRFFQGVFQHVQGLPCGSAVKNVPGQKEQIAALPAAELRDFPG